MASWGVVIWASMFFGLSQGYIDKTVYQYLVDNGYSSFVQLLKEAHQDQVLSGSGPVTVFAPSNAAIAKLDPNIMASLARNEWQKTAMVKYHVIDDFILIPFLHGRDALMTSAGQKMTLQLSGGSLLINNATQVAPSPSDDIICNNGVVQPIDSVLIPPLYGTDNLFAVLLERDDIYKEFTLSLTLTNLTNVLESGEYTVFGPVDAAYAKYVQLLLHPRNISQELAAKISYEMNKYHIVPGARSLDSLKHGQTLFTLHGTPLKITILTTGILVNQAHILRGDIPASNGVIHAIDDVLFPMDLLPSLGIDPASLTQPPN